MDYTTFRRRVIKLKMKLHNQSVLLELYRELLSAVESNEDIAKIKALEEILKPHE